MATYNITPELQEQLDDINQKFEQAHAEKAELFATKPEADAFWIYLKACEQYLITGTLNTLEYDHDMENILALYHLNNLIDEGHLTKLLRDVYSLPPTAVTAEMIAESWNWSGWVMGDGTIYSASRYCQLDYRWTLVMAYYYYYKLRPDKKHQFVLPALHVLNKTIPNNAKIAIIGDWGTGVWQDGKKGKCPAQLVIDGLLELKPDYIIHLGDVYYAGTAKEERQNLLNMLPASYKDKVFTMNSNHEMYDGANGLLGTSLKDPMFNQQGGSSCFSLPIGDWIFIGLDSAYYDDSYLYMKGSLCNEQGGKEQLNYLKAAYKTGKKIFLLTHHNGIEVAKKGPTPNTTLWNQVTGAMNQNVPDAWYWGHVHNGIVYRDDLSFYNQNNQNNKTSKMRCCGHASIPFGNGSYLENASKGNNPEVLYYAHTQMPDPTDEVQKLRVVNGFAVIEINGAEMTEAFYEVSNVKPSPTKVWPL
ncbi:MAG: metallophosphoesterase [Aequorivita sp.]|nr:metallophosphoesterase [Aequorivita sp.]